MTATMTPPSAERITLYYRQGASDKVYQAALEPQGEGFVVHFAFGRRGATLNTGTKTASPVDYEAARRLYDKLVREKTAKGYTPGEDGTPYRRTENEGRASGILPQLLNPVDDTQLEALLNDTLHGAQEKFDGKRVLLVKAGATARVVLSPLLSLIKFPVRWLAVTAPISALVYLRPQRPPTQRFRTAIGAWRQKRVPTLRGSLEIIPEAKGRELVPQAINYRRWPP